MQKALYSILIIITLGLIGYVGYYTTTHKKQPSTLLSIATPVEDVATSTKEIEDKNMLTTISGKKIHIEETAPADQELSTITLTPSGFATNTPIVLETNKLVDFFLADLNHDTSEELILITGGGSQAYGEATIFTTASSAGLILVAIPEITESDTKKGKLFEGYRGHDSFLLVDGALVRTFKAYSQKDTDDNPTGDMRAILYTLTEALGKYSITFSKGTSTPPIIASSTLNAATSSQQGGASSSAKNLPSKKETITQQVSSPQPTLLSGTSWTWTNSSSQGKFVLSFDTKGHMKSTTDCSVIRGDYEVEGSAVEFGSFTSTPKECVSSQEGAYITSLSEAISYSIASGTLTLTTLTNKKLTFTSNP